MPQEKTIRAVINARNVRNAGGGANRLPSFLSTEACRLAQAFHESFPIYEPTPLVILPSLARELGVGQLLVKDESHRFGLHAFKVLGAAYAMGCYLCERLGLSIEQVDFDTLRSEEARQQIGPVTFVTATDGNHGRAVAWAAAQLGHQAVVYLPKGSSQERVAAIREVGAEAHVINGNYDEAVRLSEKVARERGWQVVQDTAWNGYTKIPAWIMQGYTTMAAEAIRQLSEQLPEKKPTHLFLQAGVGSMAGAVLGYFVQQLGSDYPVTVIVEPHAAACMYISATSGDGEPHVVSGDLQTIMAGLACGEPNPLAWDILRDYADAFVSCPDHVAATGMRMLAAPSGSDPKIVSGESGAIGLGLLAAILQKEEGRLLKEQLRIREDSVILCFSTEGDTDKEQYRRIVWEGAWPSV
ncbi:diaminopropionate ammonia-lyase [Brevibacillus choshinensis]|uniref:diaminopropionate ammonia-lyase n=1 Tax=Brevibacillus choshinensis TaxID=54911 RepID=UPI002E1CB8D4|nr:diaminopropionate ammonia-lyase [Brevibacillus choshinensis]MED4583119.1 diaminopropionate ammonia-lyase [Brevibacillus choshinensis]